MDILGFVDRTPIQKHCIFSFVMIASISVVFGWLISLVVTNVEWTTLSKWLVCILIVLSWGVCFLSIMGLLFLSILYKKRHKINDMLNSFKHKYLSWIKSKESLTD